jgi:hypothetical protein
VAGVEAKMKLVNQIVTTVLLTPKTFRWEMAWRKLSAVPTLEGFNTGITCRSFKLLTNAGRIKGQMD